MLRRSIISIAGGVTLGAALPVLGQTQKTLKRVGVLMGGVPATGGHLLEAFRGALKGLGWIEGQDIVFEVRWASGEIKRLDALAAELLALKPDLMLAPSTAGALATRRLTRHVPIVFVTTFDPLGSGLIASWANPGGNASGTSTGGIEITSKRLELFKEAVTGLSRVVVMDDPVESYSAKNLEQVAHAAQQLGIKLSVETASNVSEIATALEKILRDKPDGVFVMDNPLFLTQRKTIIARMAEARVPAIYPFDDYATDGGLLVFSASFVERYQRAASFVDRILKGANPANLPAELPTKFELIVNLKTAKSLGIKFPQSILLRADRLIE